MFEGFKGDLVSFYAEIRFNNNKPFMDAHRQEYYDKVRSPFYAFIDEMAPAMLDIDPDMETRPAKCLSRINRDTRFTKDKSPYRDHHWVAWRIQAAPKEGMPFYWFEIRMEAVSWGLGIWGENKKLFDALRGRIVARPEEVARALDAADANGFTLGGNFWKNIALPEGLPERLLPLYKARDIYFEKAGVSPAMAFAPDIVARVSADFTALKPVWRLLRGLALPEDEGT